MSERKPRKFLTARWENLLMLNFQIDPTVLEPYTPSGTRLDQYNGKTFVSVVGFRFLQTRVLGIPIPFHRNFDEVNLRFYVSRECDGEIRRGVVFVKELVPRFAIAWVARTLYNENYVSLPMQSTIQIPTDIDNGSESQGGVCYRWKHDGKWNLMSGTIAGKPESVAAGSEPEFITEHYWGYAAQADGGTMEYEVQHPRWNVWQVTEPNFDCDVADLYAPEFRDALSRPPTSAFVADGSEVCVRAGVRLPDFPGPA